VAHALLRAAPRLVSALGIRLLRPLLYCVLAAASVALLVRTVFGPVDLPWMSIRSPLNAEALVSVSFVLLVLSARREFGLRERRLDNCRFGRGDWACAGLVTTATAILFWPNLRSPFVFDDYAHLSQSSQATWRILFEAFARDPGGHGLFFRPVTFISHWLDYQWAGLEPARWHAWNLTVHAANSCLIYVLTRRLGMARAAALFAGLVFALHGSRAETVSWTDARSDLLATFFVLCVLLLVQEISRTGRRVFYIPLLVCGVLAVCTKESAFCVPLLSLSLLPLYSAEQRRRILSTSLALASICAVLFAYRWWALGGIGGYMDPAGLRTIWQSSPAHSFKALFFRMWAFLFFPLNWSVPLPWILRVSAGAFLGALVVSARRAARSRGLLAGVAFVFAAALPVQHLLLLSPDLAGARYLYLPVAGLAIFWAALIDGCAYSRSLGLAALLLTFNTAALRHNLAPWRTVPASAQAVCLQAGRLLRDDPRPIVVSGLPYKKQGVYFLSNGFPQCVAINSGEDMGRIEVVAKRVERGPQAARQLVWDEKQGELVEDSGAREAPAPTPR
jgi:hypothetical protein